MLLGSKRWRVAAVGTAAALATTLAVTTSPASAATANPGTFVFIAQGGAVNFNGQGSTLGAPVGTPECSNGVNDDIAADNPAVAQDENIDLADSACTSAFDNSEVLPGYQPMGTLSLQAAVAANGTMSSFVLKFPPVYKHTSIVQFGASIGLQVWGRLTPAQVSTGTADPVTGAVNINLKMDLVFTPLNANLSYGAISNCLSTVDLNLSTTDTFPANPLDVNPVPYDPATGTVTVTDNNFAMPATTVGVSTCDTLYGTLGLPGPAGGSMMELQQKAFPTANTAPTATTPAPQNVSGGAVVALAGAGTDPNTVPCGALPCPTPAPQYFRWTQTSGTAVTLSDRYAQNPTFTAPNTTETLTFQLEVADGATSDVSSETVVKPANGAMFTTPTYAPATAYSAATATATVNVSAGNVAPVANAGSPQSVNEGATVNLDGTASTDGGDGPGPLTYAWSQTGGPTVNLIGATTATPSFTAPLLDCPGSKDLTFSLTVNDGTDSSTPSTVTITDNDVAPGGTTDGDYNGDGKADVATFNPTKGFWKVQCTGDVAFGAPGDIAVPGDYNGDGKTDIAIYVPNDADPALGFREGHWMVKGLPGYLVGGLQGDIPIVGNFAGGNDRPWLYRPSTGGWVTPYQAPIIFGAPGAIPVPGDYNGDGTDDLAFYVEATGNWTIANGLNIATPTVMHYGGPGFLPAPGKYDGVPGTDLTTVKVSTGRWFHPSIAFFAANHGAVGDVPASGDFSGTGTQQMGRYRASCTCHVRNPLGNLSNSIIFFGASGYKPVNSPYNITRLFP